MNQERKACFAGVIAEITRLCERIDDPSVDALLACLINGKRIFVAGAGRSGLLLRCFAMRLMHMGKHVYMVGDTLTPSAAADDVLLVGSGSGQTETLVAIMHKAKKLGMHTVLITTKPESSLGKISDTIVALAAPTPKYRDGGSEVSIQPMGNLFEQGMFVLLETVILELMRTKHITSEAMFERHANLE